MKQIHLFISGRVQGVWYRASTKQFVDSLNADIKGFVRNCYDGKVELMAEGEEKYLKQIIDFCNKGPQFARVDHVEEQWADAEGNLNPFDVLR